MSVRRFTAAGVMVEYAPNPVRRFTAAGAMVEYVTNPANVRRFTAAGAMVEYAGTEISWGIDVDWNNDGGFAPTEDESARALNLSITRGRDGLIKSDGSGFQRAQIGQAIVTLDNYDGRFDPLNTSSPLYPNVLPGRDVRISVFVGSTGYPLLRGRIQDIIPMGARRGGLARLVVQDGWEWLQSQTVKKTLQTSIRVDTAIGHVLDQAAWPSAWGRTLGTASDTLDYWWVDGESAANAINELNESEQGQFFIAADGQAKFNGRQSLFNAASSVSVAQSVILDEILTPQPWQAIRNIIRVKCYPRIVQTQSELWRMQDKPLVNAGKSLTVFAEFRYANNSRVVPATAVVTPVSATDYTANTAADGSGSDLTANFSIDTFTVFGTTAKIILTNNGASNGYVTLLKVRGQAVDAPDATLIELDASSGSAYGPRALTLDLRWQQDTLTATDLVYWLKSLLDDPLSFPVIVFEHQPTYQFPYDLFTRVTLTVAALGISADYYIGKIQHDWLTANGQATRTIWHLEPADQTGYWKFTTTLGVTSRFAY